MQVLNTILLGIIFFLFIVTLLTLWITSIRRQLQKLEECCRREQYQAAVLVHSRLDSTDDLLQYAAQHGMQKAWDLSATLCTYRIADVKDMHSIGLILGQDALADSILAQYESYAGVLILSPSDQEEYRKKLGAPPFFAKMLVRSRDAYDVAVENLNRKLRRFPVKIIGKMMRIQPRACLRDEETKTDYVRKEN